MAKRQGLSSIRAQLNRQALLDDDAFANRTRAALDRASEDANIPHAQRRPPTPPLAELAGRKDRNSAMAAAHATDEYSYQRIAEAFGV